jgi:hypothetical protein
MDGMDAGDGDDSSSSSDSKAIVYGVIFGTLGLWLLGVVVSTKGCRKFGYDHKYRYNSSNANNNNANNESAEDDDPVWVHATLMSQAERLQRQQQRQQATADDSGDDDAVFLQERTPEELAAMIEEIQEKVAVRTAFLERTLPRLDYDADQHKGDKCTICLTAYAPTDCLTGSNRNSSRNNSKDGSNDDYCCLHQFHRDCIKDWLVGKAICPVCRNVFLEQDAKRLKKAAVSGGDETPSGEELVDVIAADKDEEAANLDIESEVTGTGLPDTGARQ